MKRIVGSLIVASVAFLNTFGQGIENKLWVAKVEQGDNIILANEGIAMFYLNSLSKEYVIAPLDDSIEYSSGTYSNSQSGSKYILISCTW
ncbi:MAG: hypothetical protein ACFHW5_18430 [Verrucomicrobiota bacterium]